MFCLPFQTTWWYPRGPFLLNLVLHPRAYVCIIYETTKGKFPEGHHGVWVGEIKHTSWEGLLLSFGFITLHITDLIKLNKTNKQANKSRRQNKTTTMVSNRNTNFNVTHLYTGGENEQIYGTKSEVCSRTDHFENGIGFPWEFLLKSCHSDACYLGYTDLAGQCWLKVKFSFNWTGLTGQFWLILCAL